MILLIFCNQQIGEHQKTWFGSKHVVLKPIPKFDHSKFEHLSEYEQSIAMAKFYQKTTGEGKRISFYKNLEMKYTYSLRCDVGELIKTLKNFVYIMERYIPNIIFQLGKEK